jgi:hypothetical protein
MLHAVVIHIRNGAFVNFIRSQVCAILVIKGYFRMLMKMNDVFILDSSSIFSRAELREVSRPS